MKSVILGALFLVTTPFGAAHSADLSPRGAVSTSGCCSYGCCDCGCVTFTKSGKVIRKKKGRMSSAVRPENCRPAVSGDAAQPSASTN